MRVSVKSIAGENAVAGDDGRKLFAILEPEISARRVVELDFAGVRVFASPFFNASMGKFMATFTKYEVTALVKCMNLSSVGESVLNLVLQNSEECYRNPDARKALDDILSSRSDTNDVDPES